MLSPDRARTVASITRFASEKVKCKKFNCSHPPSFQSIPVTRVIPDSLHLLLRIADQLIHQFVKELKHADNIVKLTNYDRHKMKKIAAFEDFLKSIGIHDFAFHVDKDSKILKYRDFTGPDKYKILKNIKLLEFLPIPRAHNLKAVWDNFLVLMNDIQMLEQGEDQKIYKFKNDAKNWVTSYVNLYQTKDATPYMHILTNHVHETVQLNGNMTRFTMQGLEKLNDCVTKRFYGSTSFGMQSALKQVMQKHNRLALLEMSNARRKPKFQWKCSNCNNFGHSSKTCQMP